MTPGPTPGSLAATRAAAPATSAAAVEVPESRLVPPPASRTGMSTPGAAMKTLSPEFEKPARASSWFVADTPTTPGCPAG